VTLKKKKILSILDKILHVVLITQTQTLHYPWTSV